MKSSDGNGWNTENSEYFDWISAHTKITNNWKKFKRLLCTNRVQPHFSIRFLITLVWWDNQHHFFLLRKSKSSTIKNVDFVCWLIFMAWTHEIAFERWRWRVRGTVRDRSPHNKCQTHNIGDSREKNPVFIFQCTTPPPPPLPQHSHLYV